MYFRILLISFLIVLSSGSNLVKTVYAQGNFPEVCDDLEEADDNMITISVKYRSVNARDLAIRTMNPFMHLDFISRVVGVAAANDALTLCKHTDVVHMELIARTVRDITLHRLLEVYRVYLYARAGTYPIAVVNFSQGVRTSFLGRNISGERTLVEALDAISRDVAPVFISVGNSPDFGLDPYSKGEATFAVVATDSEATQILPTSSRPSSSDNTQKLFLLSDGARRPISGPADAHNDNACNWGDHLTLGQLLQPEDSRILGGGSSFATFAVTPTACYVHQYLEIMATYLPATRPVGMVNVEPFVSYFIDNPIDRNCPALKHRLAQNRRIHEAEYVFHVDQKIRFRDFFVAATVEIDLRYSTRLLREFFLRLPRSTLVPYFEGPQRLVDSDRVVSALRKMTLEDWVHVAGNSGSYYYPEWLRKAAQDKEPVLDNNTIETIVSYCEERTLFLVLPDVVPSAF